MTLTGMAAIYANLEREGRDWLQGEGAPGDSHALLRSRRPPLRHQGSELTVPYRRAVVDEEGLTEMLGEFHSQHRQLYGFSLDQPVEIVTLRVTASGPVGRRQYVGHTHAFRKFGRRHRWTASGLF